MTDDDHDEKKRDGEAARPTPVPRVAYVGLAILGLAVVALTVTGVIADQDAYAKLFADAREATRACPGTYLAYTVALGPFRSFAFFRAAVVFLSFGIIVVGAVFIL